MKTRIFSLLLLLSAGALFAQKGNLDPTFGIQGLLTTIPWEKGTQPVLVSQIYPLQDGRIYLAGKFTHPELGEGCFLARLTSSGAYDATFGSGGMVQVDSFEQDVESLIFAPDSSVILLERGGTRLAGFSKSGMPSFAPMRVLNGGVAVSSPTVFVPNAGGILLLVQKNADGSFALQGRDYTDGSLFTNFGNNGLWPLNNLPLFPSQETLGEVSLLGVGAAYAQKLMVGLTTFNANNTPFVRLGQLNMTLDGAGNFLLNWNTTFRGTVYDDGTGNPITTYYAYHDVGEGGLAYLLPEPSPLNTMVYPVLNKNNGRIVYGVGYNEELTYLPPQGPSFEYVPVNTAVFGVQNANYQSFVLPAGTEVTIIEGIAPFRFGTYPPAPFYCSRAMQGLALNFPLPPTPIAVQDSTIGTDGHLTLCDDGYWNQPLAAARQSDGKILVGGIRIDSLDSKTLFVARIDLSLNTALSPAQAPEIRVYPNPARDWVAIESALPVQSTRLINLQGQVVKTFAKNEAIDIQGIVSGLYLLKVETAAGTQTVKLTID